MHICNRKLHFYHLWCSYRPSKRSFFVCCHKWICRHNSIFSDWGILTACAHNITDTRRWILQLLTVADSILANSKDSFSFADQFFFIFSLSTLIPTKTILVVVESLYHPRNQYVIVIYWLWRCFSFVVYWYCYVPELHQFNQNWWHYWLLIYYLTVKIKCKECPRVNCMLYLLL